MTPPPPARASTQEQVRAKPRGAEVVISKRIVSTKSDREHEVRQLRSGMAVDAAVGAGLMALAGVSAGVYMPTAPVPVMICAPGGRTIRGDQGHFKLGEHIASQSEVIRAIVSSYSSSFEGPRTCLQHRLAQ